MRGVYREPLAGAAVSVRNPTDDMPSVESEQCCVGGCREPWAWNPDGSPRTRLCEAHSDEWLRAERDLTAEREEVAGRERLLAEATAPEWSALFGLARTLERLGRRQVRRRA